MNASDSVNQSRNSSDRSEHPVRNGPAKSNAIEIPSISLPKGGGAIRSIDEKFAVNAVNGTSSLSIPLPISPARDFSPALSLIYNSGTGNGLFGLGWSLNLPSIRRKTENQLPQYRDLDDSDTYVFSGSEELVPQFEKNNTGNWITDAAGQFVKSETNSPDGKFRIRRYIPRIEGSFTRIERWTNKATGIAFWKTISSENVTSVYGEGVNARIADPGDKGRIFEWLLEYSFDDKGNICLYEFLAEDLNGLPRQMHNQNRQNGNAVCANSYLARILYGNKKPYLKFGDALPAPNQFVFENVFDYGQYDTSAPPYSAITGTWHYRSDAFSNYRSGFEIRTCRRCERVLLYHRFDELPGGNALIKVLALKYGNSGADGFTFLQSAVLTGYTKHDDGSYSFKSFPPFAFTYEPYAWNKEVREIDTPELEHAPAGVDGHQYTLTDLFSEGLAGILSEQGEGWFYKSNLMNGRFSPARPVAPKPSFTGLENHLELTDLDADGLKQLVSWEREPKGFFELNDDNKWESYRSFRSIPLLDRRDGNTRKIELTGTGKADLLITADTNFTWYPSLGKTGYGSAQQVYRKYDEEKGPAIEFQDKDQSIFLADMTGDGLTDLVRIRNADICYWPNLGYGKFGSKVSMDNAPLFDSPDLFNPSLIRIADIDGSGTSDIIYLGKNTFTIWLNQQGNAFSTTPVLIDTFPEITNSVKINASDILGTGLICLVWNSTLPGNVHRPLKYIDLMSSRKPHILTSYSNNLGKDVSLDYTPSTKFYIADKLAGSPWVTKLHFPVWCVTKVTTYERIRKMRFATEYTYHHGYYDHAEREFRGFGRVEQTDSETIEHFIIQSAGAANNVKESDLHQPPVLTKTWYHTGAFLNDQKILHQFAHEYFKNSISPEKILPEPAIPAGLSGNEYREALRTCKSFLLRKEVYALDKTADADNPFVCEQHNCLIKYLQPRGNNKSAVFMSHESEAIIYHYERALANPRVAHSFVLDINEYAQVLSSAEVVYPRRSALATPEQAEMHIRCKENSYTNDIQTALDHRIRHPHFSIDYEITGLIAPVTYFSREDLRTARDNATLIDYEKKASGILEKRVLSVTRQNYLGDDAVTILPFGTIQSKGLAHENYKAAFSDGLLANIFTGKLTAQVLLDVKNILKSSNPINVSTAQGGYVLANIGIPTGAGQTVHPYYWARSGFATYDKNQFFLPVKFTDGMGHATTLIYESKYHLGIESIKDAKNNTTTVSKFNYRTLSPFIMTDANGNRSAARYDELGMVIRTFLLGSVGGNEGDLLDETKVEPKGANDAPTTELSYSLQNWALQVPGILKADLEKFNYKPNPNFVKLIAYETHFKPAMIPRNEMQVSYSYSDGSGREIMKKVEADAGNVFSIAADGQLVRKPDGTPLLVFSNPRWIATGRTILNNKGNPVKQYEPFFSDHPGFEDEGTIVEVGVTPIIHYDPLDRMTRTDYPDGTFAKTIFDGWSETTFDQNDTVLTNESDAAGNPLPPTLWYQRRIAVAGTVDADAAQKTAAHNNSPSVKLLDSLGRAFLSISDNGALGKYETRTRVDAAGQPLLVTDAMQNPVMEYAYDMSGRVIFQRSMDAGRRWQLHNMDNKPLLSWDEKNHRFSFVYDALKRPLLSKISLSGAVETVYDKLIYGDDPLAPAGINGRGRPWKHFDTAGMIVNAGFDFKGNILSVTQELLQKFDHTDITPVDWTNNLPLAPAAYLTATTYDALNRPVSVTHTADQPNTTLYSYNKPGSLKRVQVSVRGQAATDYVRNIEYNAKGQRTLILYGNNVRTAYEYDRNTFRLTRLFTTRKITNAGNAVIEPVQDLNYTYDAAGNITFLTDKAQQVIFFRNQLVNPSNEYTYDAVYRLIEAKGREHIGQQRAADESDAARMNNLQPGNGNNMQPYTQQFSYDKVGNMLAMKNLNSWSRTYTYNNTNAVAASNNNQLLSAAPNGAALPGFLYTYDAHGNMRAMPHLSMIDWEFRDKISATSQQVVANGGTGETTYYVYDSAGQRTRKVTLRQGTQLKKDERIYLGDLELYISYQADGVTPRLQRETLHVNDDTRRIALTETKTLDRAANDNTQLGVVMVRYQHGNHLGSAAVEISGDALNPAIISYEEYYPFGSTSYQARDKNINPVAKRYRFAGKERDEESGNYYYGARYYVPFLARWASCDPVQDKSTNLYCFANNSPCRYTDPDGKEPLDTAEIDLSSGARTSFRPGYQSTRFPLGFNPNAVARPNNPVGIEQSPNSATNTARPLNLSAPSEIQPLYAPAMSPVGHPYQLPPDSIQYPYGAPGVEVLGGPYLDPISYSSQMDFPPLVSDPKYLELAKSGKYVSHSEVSPKGAIIYLEFGKFGFPKDIQTLLQNKYNWANYLIKTGVFNAQAHAGVEYSSRLSKAYVVSLSKSSLLSAHSGRGYNSTGQHNTNFEIAKRYFEGLQVDEFISRFIGGPQTYENQGLMYSRVNASIGPTEYWAAKDLKSGTRILQFKISFRGPVAPSYKGKDWYAP